MASTSSLYRRLLTSCPRWSNSGCPSTTASRSLFASALQLKAPTEAKGHGSPSATPTPTEAAAANAVTHTGQQWSPDDIRMARFLHRPKEVNEKWAIDLIHQHAPKEVHSRIVSCDGGGGALGHPRVYINLDANEPVSCIYCGLRFIHKHH